MSPTPVVSLSYTLQPPASTPTPPSGTPTTLQQSLPLTLPAPSSGIDAKTYYTALSASVLEAQSTLNQHLTSWKDAIGDAEKAKEDLGKVGFGKGKAARMTMADKAAADAVDGGEGEEEDEDEE